MDQIECFNGVKLLRRSGDLLKRRTGFNCSVFSTLMGNTLLLHNGEQVKVSKSGRQVILDHFNKAS